MNQVKKRYGTKEETETIDLSLTAPIIVSVSSQVSRKEREKIGRTEGE
jgi:hypothetical protein